MTMKRLRKIAARLPEAATRPLAHAVMALGPVAMCGAGGAKPESWWLPAGFMATVIAIQWAWQSGRDAGGADACRHLTTALRSVARDHSGDVNEMVPDHIPDVGKKEEPHG